MKKSLTNQDPKEKPVKITIQEDGENVISVSGTVPHKVLSMFVKTTCEKYGIFG